MLRTITFCALYALLNVTGAAIIKWQLKGKQLSEFKQWVNLFLDYHMLIAIIFIFLSSLVLFKALAGGQFTFIVPVATGINFILTVVAGYFIFKDQFNYLSFIGFALILSGIVILSLNNTQHVR